MAQHDYIISNQTFPNTRADLNNALQAIATNNSGSSAPTTLYAGQFWLDTNTPSSTTWSLYIHDGSDNILFAEIDTSANTVNFTDSALDVVTDTTPQLGGNLDLNSNDITGTGNINITGNATVSGDLTVDTNTLYVDSSNNRVGIGTSSPSQTLHVEGNLLVDAYNNAGEGGGIFLRQGYETTAQPSITVKDHSGSAPDGISVNGSDGVSFRTADTERMRIDASGNVGIGSSSPSSPLYVEKNSAGTVSIDGSTVLTLENNSHTIIQMLSPANSSNRIYFGDPDNNGGGRITYDHNTNMLSFNTNTSERVRIDSSGNVGIGTSSPSFPLHVSGKIYGTGVVASAGNSFELSDNNVTIKRATNDMTLNTGGAERMRIDSSGNVLIGTTSTSINSSNFGIMMQQAGTLSVSSNQGAGNTVTEAFGNAGQFRVMGDGDAENTNNRYGALSDRTLKENETSANSQWDDIKALQIKNYNLIEYPDRTHIGVIAQDLESAGMNGLVKTNSDGLKSVAYSVLYMKAVKALQEAMQKIEDLEARVDTLEGN